MVLFAFLAIIAAFGALVRFGQAGRLLERATTSSSHGLGAPGVGGLQDILLY